MTVSITKLAAGIKADIRAGNAADKRGKAEFQKSDAHHDAGRRADEEAQQRWLAAGEKIIRLQNATKGKPGMFKQVLSEHVGISVSQAYAYMKIAKGKATLADHRSKTAERTRAARANSATRRPVAESSDNVVPLFGAADIAPTITADEFREAAALRIQQAREGANWINRALRYGHAQKEFVAEAKTVSAEWANLALALEGALKKVVA